MLQRLDRLHAFRPVSRAFPILLVTGALTIAWLAILSLAGFEILASVRAYVQGEGEWSKAQKQSVASLLRYGRTADPADLADYRAAIEVTLGDRQARVALDRSAPDDDAARAGFLLGRNHPDDASRLIRLFRIFRHEPHFRHAITVWAAADVEIEALEQVAAEIEAAHGAAVPAPAMDRLIARVEAIDRRLGPLEHEFSATLGVASRLAHRWLAAAIVIAGVLLLATGGIIVHRLVRDVRRSQEALHESDREHAAILQGALDAVITMDQLGRVVAFNHAAEAMFGITRAEAIGREMITLIAPREMWEPHRRGLAHHLATGETGRMNRRLEMTAARSDGIQFPIELTIIAVPGIVPPRFTGFMRDLTERRRSEERLAQAQRLETVGRLAGGVAHDFNNVLTAILGFSEILQDRLEAAGQDTMEVRQIRVAADRARSLTAQLLAFGCKQMMTLEPLSLNAVVTESGRLIERLAGEAIAVRLELDPDEQPVRADAGQLQQVLLNLAVNARDAMPGGGVLTIASHAEPDGRHMRLTVSDTGCGMTPDVQSRIFEPFFTTKGPGGGTGLGLATAYGTVSQLGGRITVTSAVGAGTSFQVVLPVTSEKPLQTESPDRPVVTRCGSRILIVEDEDAVRDLVQRVLRKRGYRILAAASAEEALDLLRTEGDPIDLLLSDVVMGGMDGRSLALRLREKQPGLNVILMSGYSEEHLGQQGPSADDLILLRKPFTVAQLEEAVASKIDTAPATAHAAGRRPATAVPSFALELMMAADANRSQSKSSVQNDLRFL